jgi:glycosyltransferase involved in cell wall biosynthesis
MMPLVSVVIATYNTGRFLPETLDSVLAQTYRHYEIIVVDDGSTDDTLVRIQTYLSNIRFVQRAHRGLAAARNAGLQMATGDYIALLDADDLWLPDKLAVQVEIARREPASGMIACDGEEFGTAMSRPFLLYRDVATALHAAPHREVTGNFHRAFIRFVPIRCPAQTLIPRSVVEAIGPFGDFEAQDYDYYLRLSARFPVTFHAHALVRCRDREDSMSGPSWRRPLTWSRQRQRVLRAYTRRCEPQYRVAATRQLGWNRACVAFYYGQFRNRRRARRALLLLLWRQHWPPAALPFLLTLAVPRLVQIGYRWWTHCLALRQGLTRMFVGKTS